jgi:hypothetical protein
MLDILPSRHEYKLIFPRIKFPFTVHGTTFNKHPDMLDSEFYCPVECIFAFLLKPGDQYNRAGNVIATDSQQPGRSWEGTLYISIRGAYMLVQEKGMISMSGSEGAIHVPELPKIVRKTSRFEGIYDL